MNITIPKLFFRRIIAPILIFHRKVKVTRLFLTLFALFIFFFDENSILKRIQYHWKIMELTREINHYKNEIEGSKARFNELNSNRDNLEKFAREQFLMKKSNEDIYLIDPED